MKVIDAAIKAVDDSDLKMDLYRLEYELENEIELIDNGILLPQIDKYRPFFKQGKEKESYKTDESCTETTEDQEAYSDIWISAKSKRRPPFYEWLLVTVKIHSWITNLEDDWVDEKDKIRQPEEIYVTLAMYNKQREWLVLTQGETSLCLEREDFEEKEDLRMPLVEVLAWAKPKQYKPKEKKARLIDADKLIKHLSDYAYQVSPMIDDGDDSAYQAYQAVMNCIGAVQDAETVEAMPDELEKRNHKEN